MSEEREEQRSDSVVDILQRRLGTRYRSSMEKGRDDIVSVLCEELSMERAQADELVSRMIESRQLRYVTAEEQDLEVDRDAQYDEHTDQAYQVGSDRATLADDVVVPPIVPPGGGPQAGAAGMSTGTGGMPAMPAAVSGTGSPSAVPLMHPASDVGAPGERFGYWDICSDAAGVVPSRFRKGQVEPRGT